MGKGSERRPSHISRKMENLNELLYRKEITLDEFVERRQKLIDNNEYFKKGWK